MEKLEINEIKKFSLDILVRIDSICKENDLNYSLAYGTLLGAIRHKGFIPWDDDIDIFMPRPDFLKFIKYCENNDVGFKIVTNQNTLDYGYVFAKACDERTIVKNENIKFNNFGIQVDIFPVDGLANSYQEAIKNFNKTKLPRELLVAWNWKNFKRSKTHKWYIEPIRFTFYLFSRLLSKEKLVNYILKKINRNKFDECDYVGVICGAYRAKEIMEKKIYTEYVDVEFEKMNFKAIKDYDTYLTSIYGKYMELPPLEKRITHHTFEAYKI